MKCIYCSTEILPSNSSDEHVFPAAFGCPNDWILKCVCRDCNVKFGGSIDHWLATDSLEGVIRIQMIGSKSKNQRIPRRFRFTIPTGSQFGNLQGVILHPDYTTRDQVLLPSQVGFLDKALQRHFFTTHELRVKEYKKKIVNFSKTSVVIIGKTQHDHDSVVRVLKEEEIIKDYDPQEFFFEPSEKIKILLASSGLDVLVAIDNDIQRAVAKISFNYLAKVMGAEYALSPAFNQIREFINDAIVGAHTKGIVTPSNEPILFPEQRYGKSFRGHLFTLERVDNFTISDVSLFNSTKYRVVLSDSLGSMWSPLKSIHAYDVEQNRFIPAVGVSREMLPFYRRAFM